MSKQSSVVIAILLARCRPFRDHIGVALLAMSLGALHEPVTVEAAESPHRSAAHQRRSIIEQAFRFTSKPPVVGVADGDQHIAHETIAAYAFDRALFEQRA